MQNISYDVYFYDKDLGFLMNRYQIIEKISKIIGVNDNDKFYLIDIFISKLYELLKSGQKIKIDNLGYFHKIKFELLNEIKVNYIANQSDEIIVFSENEILDGEISEEQIFWKPVELLYDFTSKEHLLSVGIDRDLLTNQKKESNKIFIPVSQNEFYDLITSKVDSIISISSVIENKQNDVPCLKINLENNQSNYNIEQATISSGDIDVAETKKIEEPILEIPKNQKVDDFSELFDSPFNELENIDESLSSFEDIKHDTPSNLDEILLNQEQIFTQKKEVSFEDLSTNMQLDVEESNLSSFENLDEIENGNEEDNIDIQTQSYFVEGEIESGEISWDKIISEINAEEDDISFEQLFEDKKDETVELEEVVFEKNNRTDFLQDNFDIPEISEVKKDDKEDIFDEIITEIKEEPDEDLISPRREFSLDEVEDLTEEKVEQEIDSTRDLQIQDEISEDEAFDSDEELVDEKELESVEEEFTAPTKKTTEISEDINQRKVSKIWYLVIVSIFLSTAALTYYLLPEYFHFLNPIVKEINPTISDNEAIRIERDFTIPVTYPYPPVEVETVKQLQISAQNIETKPPQNSSDTQIVEEKSNLQKNLETPKQQVVELKNQEKISETLSKSGENYIIQVASFKSEQVAIKEVNRLKSKGYSAFVEKAEIPNRGVWYRIKVSGFNSPNEAQNFQIKYNKGEI